MDRRISRRGFLAAATGAGVALAWPHGAARAQGDAPFGTTRLVPIEPERWCDTRTTLGVAMRNDRGTVRIPLPHRLPAMSAIAATITVVGHGEGFVTAYPAGEGLPTASVLNFRSGEIRSNGALLAVSPLGIEVFVSAPCDLIVDVGGYFERAATEIGRAHV